MISTNARPFTDFPSQQPPFLTSFVETALNIPVPELPSHLASYPRIWPFPRGDLYHWIGILDHFDGVLASVIEKYSLKAGPQTTPFGRDFLVDSYAKAGGEAADVGRIDAKLTALGYGPEGDRELVESILVFSRLLMEKCGNRSLYSSSDRLGELLNTTSLSLLQATLRLSLTLAQRYHSRQRGSSHLQQSLLAAHYNIELEKLQKVASPFPRPFTMAGKGTASPDKVVEVKVDANDMTSLTREDHGWEEWGNVHLLYYPSGAIEKQNGGPQASCSEGGFQEPTTPTPLHRTSNQQTSRSSTFAPNAKDSPAVSVHTPPGRPEEVSRGGKVLDIPYDSVSSSKPEDLLALHLRQLPAESVYDLLHRIRVAKGLATSQSTRQQVLAVRILAVSNLAYVYPESLFQQKILQHDIEQPKRLQLAYQLAELVHLGASGDLNVSRTVQTLTIQALDSLAKHKARAIDVCAALNVNVNHGILMFLMRKAVDELGSEDDDSSEEDWQDALLALLRTLPGSSARTPETLVAAGLIPMFVDILNLRTDKARRVYSRVMEFLDTFVHTVRDVLATLTSSKGFDAISNLIESEAKTAYANVQQGEGIPDNCKTAAIDYQVPYFQQQTLRWLFRFVNHLMQHGGGGYDRVLRNLIDSPQLLTSLRLIFQNAPVFGSHVWSGAVIILSSFINNEPTSYGVIAEAGLSKTFLEAVMASEMSVSEGPNAVAAAVSEEEGGSSSRVYPDTSRAAPTASFREGDRERKIARPAGQRLAPGILPSAEAISCIPSAFGAICLNSSGLGLFQSSHAMESLFEIFENPRHVKCMKDDDSVSRSLGSSFDELARHHPALKPSIMSAVIVMTARVGFLCRKKTCEYGIGAKIWVEDALGKPTIAGGNDSLVEEVSAPLHRDVLARSHPLPNGSLLVIGDDAQITRPPSDSSWVPRDEDEHGLTVTDYMYPTLRFLATFFENQANCSYFIDSGGVEFVLDFATSPGIELHFHSSDACAELAPLVHMMAETKPHLVIPSLVNRTQSVVHNLSSFWGEPHESGFFTSFIRLGNGKEPDSNSLARTRGTHFIRHMVVTLSLMDILRELYSVPLYQTRPSQQLSTFMQVNLAEKYSSLVSVLGKLHSACVWEEILLQKVIPPDWKAATKGSLNEEETSMELGIAPTAAEARPEEQSQSWSQPNNASGVQDSRANEQGTSSENKSITYNNVRTTHFLLNCLPGSIANFIHNLGVGLIGKRRMDAYQRQNAYMVADSIADTIIRELQYRPALSSDDHKQRSTYLIIIMSFLSQLLLDPASRRTLSHYLTLILFAFKRKGGLKVVKRICDVFVDEVKAFSAVDAEGLRKDNEVSSRLTSAYGGIKIIFAFFAEIVSGKNIVDSNQTQSMTSSERDRDLSDYFQPGQFLVDLRMEILPMVRDFWNSEFGVKSTSSVVKRLVDILRSCLDGEYETGAIRRPDSIPALLDPPHKIMAINKDRVNILTEKGFSKELAEEALYRCNNNSTAAEEYCNAQGWLHAPPRMPPPPNDVDAVKPNTAASGGDSSENTSLGDDGPASSPFLERSALAMILAQASGSTNFNRDHDQNRADRDDAGNGPEFLANAFNHILNDEHNAGDDESRPSSAGRHHPASGSGSSSARPAEENGQDRQPVRRREVITVEDLDAEREKVRSNIIERCLDILSVHHDVSFELADLIAAATKKHPEPESFRREVGETLVQSLVSLQMEDFQASDKKVAAYAHLLALVVQDRDMYSSTLEELKESFSTLVTFIRIPSADKSPNGSFSWIGHVLLILERLLSDDAQPQQIRWTPPIGDNVSSDDEPAQLHEPLISSDEKGQLFKALIEILPRVGKDNALALSICRILVILTRSRSIAVRLGEKRNLQRLFIMVKQLAGSTDARLQGAFMLVLRHVVEDEDTVRQIMRSEIVAAFEAKSTHQIDTTSYVRQMYHLVLRSPELFVEVSNEKLTLLRYDSHQRPQTLTLKKYKNLPSSDLFPSDETEKRDQQPATEGAGTSEEKDKDKAKGPELKAPVVERPDGVIHYLLSEILSYKDVDDKEPVAAKVDTTLPVRSDAQEDVEMTDEPSATPSHPTPDSPNARAANKKQEKPAFKADEHPIYIYRCFLLQCLTELLFSYNRTKVEFINFSPKADPLTTTPSKPRSGILNYLLNVLVPVGTLEHDESVQFKKRSNTSAWAIRVLVALCAKTSELGGTASRRRNERDEEDEPELAFVRRFVLEHALRSYKDANASWEYLDVKYARLLSLAELFEKMLGGYSFGSGDAAPASSTKHIAKTMYEKHFISALTASVAEIDLNFPMSKRVIKYILRPLAKLTQSVVYLSGTSEISSPGETEDNEISSATSVSDMEDDREETPDLFRHSTLGMLEPRHEEESSSEESGGDDDEIYDDEYGGDYGDDYGDEMDYDEEGDGEIVSDEDEGDDDVGPIEGLPGDGGMDVEVVIDEDEVDGDEDDDEDEDEEEDDDDGEDDEGQDMEEEDEIFAGEITGENDNTSLGGGDQDYEDQWESEGVSEDEEENEMMDQFEDELADAGRNDRPENRQHLDYLFRALNDAAEGVDDMHGDGIRGDLPEDVDDDLNDDDGRSTLSLP